MLDAPGGERNRPVQVVVAHRCRDQETVRQLRVNHPGLIGGEDIDVIAFVDRIVGKLPALLDNVP